jgi:hypothetical protein
MSTKFEVDMTVAVFDRSGIRARRVIVSISPKRGDIKLNDESKYDSRGYSGSTWEHWHIEPWTDTHAVELKRRINLQTLKGIHWETLSADKIQAVLDVLKAEPEPKPIE